MFDPLTGNLWVGDQADATYEELNVVRRGKHYGVPWREGDAGTDVGVCAAMTPESGNCEDPVYFCRPQAGSAGVDGRCADLVTGPIFDDCSWPTPWRGRLYFAASAGLVYALRLNAARDGPSTDGAPARSLFATLENGTIGALRSGPQGDLFIALGSSTAGLGRIVRISPRVRSACATDGGEVVDEVGGNPLPDRRGDDDFEPRPCGCSTTSSLGLGALLLCASTLWRSRFRRRPR